MTVGEEDCQVGPDSCLGDQVPQPAFPERIADPITHRREPFSIGLEMMLVDEKTKGSFHDLVHQEMRRRHSLPTAKPAHWDHPHVATVKFDLPPFDRRSIRDQSHQFHCRRHDHGEVSWIGVEGEQPFRSGGDAGAGLEDADGGFGHGRWS